MVKPSRRPSRSATTRTRSRSPSARSWMNCEVRRGQAPLVMGREQRAGRRERVTLMRRGQKTLKYNERQQAHSSRPLIVGSWSSMHTSVQCLQSTERGSVSFHVSLLSPSSVWGSCRCPGFTRYILAPNKKIWWGGGVYTAQLTRRARTGTGRCQRSCRVELDPTLARPCLGPPTSAVGGCRPDPRTPPRTNNSRAPLVSRLGIDAVKRKL